MRPNMRPNPLLIAVVCALAGLSPGAQAQAPADFFRGKQINLHIGFTAGGGYDLYARVLARHMARHVPGHPTIVPQNMPGAGSLRVANFIYQVAPRDGLAFATMGRASVIAPLFGQVGGQFDPRRFSWLGSANDEVSVCASWHTSSIRSFDDLKSKPAALGATGPGEEAVQLYKVMNALFGAQIRIVSGYPGGNEINLAIERGEIDGRCALSWSSIKATLPSWIEQKKLNILAQVSFAKHADLPQVPLLIELAPNEEVRGIVKFLAARQVMGRPFFAPPEVPADRAAALRKAFMDTLKDPQFLAEADRAKLEITPVEGERIEELLRELYATPAHVVRKAAELFN